MKFIAEKSAIEPVAATVCPIAKAASGDILAQALVRAGGETVTLTATDMKIQMSATAKAQVAAPGAVCVDATRLRGFLSSLQDGSQVEGELRDGRLVLRSGRARATLGCLDPNDFPRFGVDGQFSHQFEIASGALATLFAKTGFAMSTEETRFYLCGAFLHVDSAAPAVLRVATTDGHRLARAEVPLPEGAAGMPGALIPRDTVLLFHKLAGKRDQIVDIEIGETIIRACLGTTTIASKLIEGTFPDIERVIPPRNAAPFGVDRARFVTALRRAEIASERTEAAEHVVRIDIQKDGVVITGRSDGAEIVEEIEARHAGRPMLVGFNAKYLREAIETIDGETIEFHLEDVMTPCLIADPSAPAGDVLVVMPYRI